MPRDENAATGNRPAATDNGQRTTDNGSPRRMPTYDYHCDACQHEFEHFQSIKDDLLKTCPECGKPKLRRLIGTGAAIVFKGSGFYQTDYRSESYKKRAAEDKPQADGGAKSDSSAKGDATSKSSDPKPDGAPAKTKPSSDKPKKE